ncbi:MAG: L,D-transpeptidase [Rhizobiaceae bacterium]|nr:L,D-transpeptidase [Rhizobiaceae bacterium]MCV0408434.1 L,D-transpeptidase [Rhizobiaceae bacterium]
MASYEITVRRNGAAGKLEFTGGGVSVNTTCWWDANHVIVAGEYPSWRTRMNSKKDSVTKEKRPGIWLGKNVPYGDGSKTSDGIFIHEGTGPSWSDGCVVLKRDEMMKMWNAIIPDGTANVLVKVVDGAGA